jgi:hypothetical protein
MKMGVHSITFRYTHTDMNAASLLSGAAQRYMYANMHVCMQYVHMQHMCMYECSPTIPFQSREKLRPMHAYICVCMKALSQKDNHTHNHGLCAMFEYR